MRSYVRFVAHAMRFLCILCVLGLALVLAIIHVRAIAGPAMPIAPRMWLFALMYVVGIVGFWVVATLMIRLSNRLPRR